MTDEPITTPEGETLNRNLAQYVEAGAAVVSAAAVVADTYLHRPQPPEEPKPQIQLPPGVERD